MSFHIINIVKGAFYHLKNTAKIRKYINVTTAEVLVQAFINSKLNFYNSLSHGLPKYEINKLQSVQNAAARVIDVMYMFNKFRISACTEQFRRFQGLSRNEQNIPWNSLRTGKKRRMVLIF